MTPSTEGNAALLRIHESTGAGNAAMPGVHRVIARAQRANARRSCRIRRTQCRNAPPPRRHRIEATTDRRATHVECGGDTSRQARRIRKSSHRFHTRQNAARAVRQSRLKSGGYRTLGTVRSGEGTEEDREPHAATPGSRSIA